MEQHLTDRLPPHNLEAEMCVLASLMLDGNGPQFAEITASLPEQAFYQPDHQIIYRALIDLRRSGQPVDATLLREHLKSKGNLSEIGGTAYLAQIVNTVPTAAHGRHYAGIVAAKWQIREAIATANDILRQCYADGVEADKLLLEAANRLTITAATGRSDSIIPIATAVEALMNRLRGKESLFVPTGIDMLDQVITGMLLGGYTLIGADSRTGKSLVLKDIARRLARSGTSVGVIALEENDAKIACNVLAAEATVESKRIMEGSLTAEEWNRVDSWSPAVAGLPMFLRTDAMSIDAIEQTVAVMATKHHCRVVMVDHFHLIEVGDSDNEAAAQSTISGRLKAAFKRYNVCGVVAAQLNKQATKLDERPNENSIRGTKRLFNDADVVVLLYREDFSRLQDHVNKGGDPQAFTPNHLLDFIVCKNKFGPTATIRRKVELPFQRIEEELP